MIEKKATLTDDVCLDLRGYPFTSSGGSLTCRVTIVPLVPSELRLIFDALLPLARREGWLDSERPELITEEEAQAEEATDARHD